MAVLWSAGEGWGTILPVLLLLFLVTPQTTKLVLRFNFDFFFLLSQQRLKLSSLLKKRHDFEIAGGCHHHISCSPISFPLSPIPLYAPYRIMASYIWIHYSGNPVIMISLISSAFTKMCVNSFLFSIRVMYTTFEHLSRFTQLLNYYN